MSSLGVGVVVVVSGSIKYSSSTTGSSSRSRSSSSRAGLTVPVTSCCALCFPVRVYAGIKAYLKKERGVCGHDIDCDIRPLSREGERHESCIEVC